MQVKMLFQENSLPGWYEWGWFHNFSCLPQRLQFINISSPWSLAPLSAHDPWALRESLKYPLHFIPVVNHVAFVIVNISLFQKEKSKERKYTLSEAPHRGSCLSHCTCVAASLYLELPLECRMLTLMPAHFCAPPEGGTWSRPARGTGIGITELPCQKKDSCSSSLG